MPSAKKYYVYILCGLFILCSAALAGTKWYSAHEQKLKQERDAAISEAIQIYKNGDYDNAKEIFAKYAQNGDGEAMLYIGRICESYTKEYAEALKWYQKAAVKGYAADAYAAIGTMYREGTADSTLSKEDRLEKGIEFYEKAADAGNVKAMTTLGDLYLSAGDYDRAEPLYIKAADNGDWVAMCRMANVEMRRNKTRTNSMGEKARNWLEKAAQTSQDPALKVLVADEYMFQSADFGKAVEWAESAVEDGCKYGHLVLAQVCSDKEAGRYYDQVKASTNINIFTQNIRQASDEFVETAAMVTLMDSSEAKQKNYGRSLYMVAVVYYRLEQYQKAMEWCKKAETTEQNEAALASVLIGDMYRNGEGVRKDNIRAMQYYKKAAAKGDADAMIRIGEMYMMKEVSQRRDFAKAMEWFKKAAALGSSHAMYSVGVLYHIGDKSSGVERDLDAARKWYNDAVALDNNEDAQKNLNCLPAADDRQKQRIINVVKTKRYSDDGNSWSEFAEYNLEKVKWRYVGMDDMFTIHRVVLEGYFHNTAGSISKLEILFNVKWDMKENKFTVARYVCYINGRSLRRLPSWIGYALGL